MDKFIVITVLFILGLLPILSMILTTYIAWYVTRTTKVKAIYILTRVILITTILAGVSYYLYSIYAMLEPIISPKQPGDADTNGIILILLPLLIGLEILVAVVGVGVLVFIVCKVADTVHQRRI